MNRKEKETFVTEMGTVFNQSEMVIVTSYKGLTVAQVSDLRDKIRAVKGGFKVTKNRLTQLALKGTEFEGLSDLFTGTTAIAYCEDPVAISKTLWSFAKDNEKLVITGGAMKAEMMDEHAIKALATLPSMDELRAKLISIIQMPATKIAGVLQAPAGQLARVCGAYGQTA